MDHMMAEKISDRVTIPMVLSQYGYLTSRKKRIPCPLHSGKDANFCYTDRVFHCWSCGEKGNVIGLVMKLHGITFLQAVMKINQDFHLGLSTQKPTYRERQQMAEQKRLLRCFDRWNEEKRGYYRALCVLHRELFRRMAQGEAEPDIVALQGDLELWLEDNIEEVAQPWT